MLTTKQKELIIAIDCQKQILSVMPDDPVEKLVLESLYTALRNTFFVVPSPEAKQYVLSPSGSVLKPTN